MIDFNGERIDFQTLKIGLILLAAGESRRLANFPKQLLNFRGQTLLRRAAENAMRSESEKICVVLGANAGKLRAEIADLPIEIAINENWRDGMSASLKCGLTTLLGGTPNLAAVVVTLVDQPLVETVIINHLIDRFRQTQKAIVASEYASTIGVPAIFAASIFNEILNLTVEGGAKSLIKKYAHAVEKVSVSQAAFDIDTRQDYEDLLKSER